MPLLLCEELIIRLLFLQRRAGPETYDHGDRGVLSKARVCFCSGGQQFQVLTRKILIHRQIKGSISDEPSRPLVKFTDGLNPSLHCDMCWTFQG